MDIIQRNFITLLRCGAFNAQEPLEPMSHWKWNRLYQISQIHGVTPWIADGIEARRDDFFLQITPELKRRFEEDTTERTEEYSHTELTNPLLNRKLQQIEARTDEGDYTLKLLQTIINVARNILTQGISLRQLIMLGTYIKYTKDPIRYEELRTWIKQLGMERIAKLEGSMLIELFRFTPDEIRFCDAQSNKDTRRVVRDLFLVTEKKAADWYFTQGKSIFVKNSDSDAMIWHVKHSAKYMLYYPNEAFTNFIANFAHSLSHIEE